MITVRIAAFLLIVSCWGSPAWADWQYTRWGMQVEDVVSASNGAVQAVAGVPGDRVFDQDLRAEGTFEAAGIRFRAQFYFTPLSGGLSVIRLHPFDQSLCPLLEREIAGNYTSVGESLYQSIERNLLVRVTDYRGCFLAYRPVRPQNSSAF